MYSYIRLNVRFVPKATELLHRSDMTQCAITGLMHCSKGPRSLDYLVGDGEELIRQLKAERLRSPEIDDELELGRLLNR